MNSTQTRLIEKYSTVFRTEKIRTNDLILKDTVCYAFKYSKILGIDSAVDTELAIFHIESRFDPTASGDHNKSFGVGQTCREHEHRWRDYWKKRGVTLGPFESLETQVAFSVAELAFCLSKSHGDLKGGVRRYNGAGPRARKYVVQVMRARRILFSEQFIRGECVKNWTTLSDGV